MVMAENEDSGAGVLAELTPEELKTLSRALKRIETDLFNRVLKRISVLLGMVLSILLIGGLVNLSSCSSNIEASASQKLASDPELRDKVISNAQGDFKTTQDKLKGLNEQIAELENDNARAAATLVDDLTQIRVMIERINEHLSSRLQAADRNSAGTIKRKRP
jgi:hypothetical protein